MHIKFLSHGTGNGRKAAVYLTGKLDHKKNVREHVEVMRGDPFQVAAVADSLEFKHKYTSGVIAFAPEDSPTNTELNEVLDGFEETAFSGLEKDRYAFSAILHREKGGGCHIHVFSARCELDTKKSLNIAPPGWCKNFDPLRDFFNYTKGWARPDDPAKARLVRKQIHTPHLEEDPKELITNYLVQGIENGEIKNRTDVVLALEDAGIECNGQVKLERF